MEKPTFENVAAGVILFFLLSYLISGTIWFIASLATQN